MILLCGYDIIFNIIKIHLWNLFLLILLGIMHNGIIFIGTYELFDAKCLNNNNILFMYICHFMTYLFEGLHSKICVK